MKSFDESEIKYLAGLLDADGSLELRMNTGYLHLRLSLTAAESIDRDGVYIKNLASRAGQLYTRKRTENWAITNDWVVCRRNELNQLLPRLLKHMIIKAKHWEFLFKLYTRNKAIKLNSEVIAKFKNASAQSRLRNTGPCKPKNFPSKAWVAGYIDGDGWYLKRKRKHNSSTELHVGAVSHPGDRIGIDLLAKTYGGVVKLDSKGYVRWIRNLGVRDRAFAKTFLKTMYRHSRLKRYKIERFLEFHNEPQRLSEG